MSSRPKMDRKKLTRILALAVAFVMIVSVIAAAVLSQIW